MRILCLAHHVPDSRSAIAVRPDGAGIIPAGIKFVCNPFDEFAIEQAVRFKEKRGDVEEIVALTVGPKAAMTTLRSALAMGADRGIHIEVDSIPAHDEMGRARAAAMAIEREDATFDLILCGKQAIDTDSGEFGPALAELLGRPHIGAVSKLELSDDGSSLKAHRRVEGAEEVFEGSMPLLITCDKGLVEPRFVSLPNVMKAKKKPVTTLTAAELPDLSDLPGGVEFVKLEPPAPRPPCRMIEGEPEEMARELVRLLREEAKVI